MYATQTAQDTARDAVQIFGGRGITRTGMGRFIEHVSDGFALCSLVQVTDAAQSITVP
jgi:alkylation response protein AidB-like acyl-CoA dehydrogenase